VVESGAGTSDRRDYAAEAEQQRPPRFHGYGKQGGEDGGGQVQQRHQQPSDEAPPQPAARSARLVLIEHRKPFRAAPTVSLTVTAELPLSPYPDIDLQADDVLLLAR
jgi:hypothetical protein